MDAMECSNDRAGLVVVVYALVGERRDIFVREKQEFLEKFEEV